MRHPEARLRTRCGCERVVSSQLGYFGEEPDCIVMPLLWGNPLPFDTEVSAMAPDDLKKVDIRKRWFEWRGRMDSDGRRIYEETETL